MNNLNLIRDISTQMKAVCDKICSLTCGIESVNGQDESLAGVYEGLLLDEVNHAQVLALELTRATIGDEPEQEAQNADGSAFAEGELTSAMGEQEKDEEPAPVSS